MGNCLIENKTGAESILEERNNKSPFTIRIKKVTTIWRREGECVITMCCAVNLHILTIENNFILLIKSVGEIKQIDETWV